MRPLPARFAWAALLVLSAACTSAEKELESVAKDWCLTIRASQVLPVYPLTEDLRPGDVFVVPTSLSEQTRIYEERGFLPLDQLVTRLDPLDYAAFYSSEWIARDKAALEASAAAPTASSGEVLGAPRAAFPSYNFEVDEEKGLQLAIPIQGVPAGLGYMNTSRATGSVTIRDAYTYGIDSESIIGRLQEWWEENPQVRRTLSDVAQQIDEPIFLRIVTRVYLTGGVTVNLVNTSDTETSVTAGASGAAGTGGDAPESEDGAEGGAAGAATTAIPSAAPSASYDFSQQSSRAVTFDEDFARPLVIGFRGFDVKVFEDGRLSAPIPSFATLSGQADAAKISEASIHRVGGDQTIRIVDEWIDQDFSNFDRLEAWIERERLKVAVADFVHESAYRDARKRAIEELGMVEGQ